MGIRILRITPLEKKEAKNQIHNKNWIERVAEQSWEPELLISGLAVFATTQLPAYVRELFQYYQFNFQVDVGIIDELLPLLAISVFLTALQVLSFAFIFHFVVRAFWVGLMGLNSVFPNGINYEKLENSELYKTEIRKRLGDKDSFILATDKLASLVFSIAFLLVCYLFGTAVIYFFFFLIMNGVKVVVSEDVFDLYSRIIMIVAAVSLLSLSATILVLNLKRFRNNEKIAKLHFKVTWYMGMILYPFILKPIQYLMLTFLSNISKSKIQIYGVFLTIVFFGMLMSSMLDLMGVNLMESRNHFKERSTQDTYNSRFYESELGEGSILEPIIQAPILRSDEYVSLFIPYSKMLDVKLDEFCDYTEPEDSLKRFQQRAASNQYRIKCANDFFTFMINEEDTIPTDLMFTEHPKTDQSGYRSIFTLPDSLELGKQMLNIHRVSVDENDVERDSLGRSLSFEVEIPFWIKN